MGPDDLGLAQDATGFPRMLQSGLGCFVARPVVMAQFVYRRLFN